MAGQRIRMTTRDAAPCKDCTERFLACHGNCPKDRRGEYGFNAWKKTVEDVNNNRKAYTEMLRNYRRNING